MGPAPAPIRQPLEREAACSISVPRLCYRAALQPTVLGRIWPEEMRRALSGIGHLYGLHALDIGRDRYEIEIRGFASERFPREAIEHQIELCVGNATPPTAARVLDALVAAFRAEYRHAAASAVHLHGFGVFRARVIEADQFTLAFEDPLSRYFSVEHGPSTAVLR